MGPPRKSRRDSRRRDSRSRSRRGRSRSRRGRSDGAPKGGKKGKKEEDLSGAKVLSEWGTSGVIQDLKPGGVGFIRPDTGKVDDRDLFFHTSALMNGKFDYLEIGEEVTYVAILDMTKNKPQAKNIVLRNGASGGHDRNDSRDR